MVRIPAVPGSEALIAGSVSSQTQAAVLTTAEQRKHSAAEQESTFILKSKQYL